MAMTMAMAMEKKNCDISYVLFIGADDVTPLYNIFKSHVVEEEIEEPLLLILYHQLN